MLQQLLFSAESCASVLLHVSFGDRRQNHVTGNDMVVTKLVSIEGNNHNGQFLASSSGQYCAIFADYT